jgi:hypothetical protein
MRGFVINTVHLILVREIKKGGLNGAFSTHGEVGNRCCMKSQKKRGRDRSTGRRKHFTETGLTEINGEILNRHM